MPRPFVNYPTNQLLAVVDAPASADAAVRELVDAGVHERDVVRFSGERDVDRLGGLGERSALGARLLRSVQFMTMDQMPDFVVYEEAVRDGRTVIAVRAGDQRVRRMAAEVLRRHGGHFLNFYGRFATEEITLWRGAEPRIPGFLRR